MKNLLLPIILLLFISCDQSKPAEQDNTADTTVVTKTDSIITAKDTAVAVLNEATTDPIVFIRQKVEGINTAQLEKKHFEFMCDEKMMVDYFYKDGEIVKIAVDFGTVGDVYAKEDYYYDAGKLIFKYEFVEGGPACEGCIKTDEYRSYIRNNKVIKYLKNKSAGKCRKCEFTTSSKENQLLKAGTPSQVKAVLCR